MTKAEFIETVKGDYSKRAAADFADALFDSIKDALAEEGKFAYPGFGTFVVKTRASRKGKNPRTGETISIPASKTVTFRPAGKLKDEL